MEGALTDYRIDREISTALRPKHIKKDKIAMKSTGYHPPTTTNNSQSLRTSGYSHKSLIAVAVAACFTLSDAPLADTIEHGSYEINQTDPSVLVLMDHKDGDTHIYDQIKLTHEVPTTPDQFTVSITNGTQLQVDGLFSVNLHAHEFKSGYGTGNHALYVSKEGSVATLNGDIDVILKQDYPLNSIGANGIYVDQGAVAYLGSATSTTKIWAIGNKPDTLSAKKGGKIEFKSTNNQIIGSMDFLDDNIGGDHSSITGVFSGPDAYWFGDEQSWKNARIYTDSDSFDYEDMVGIFPEVTDTFELTFREGAQWSYFGISDSHPFEKKIFFFTIKGTVNSIEKRISSIRLEDGGIINLYDENIKEIWKDIKLLEVFPELANVDHDYVRIGDLKGSGGIFRLDLNADESAGGKKMSDVVFIEGSSDPGQHWIEPYKPHLLTSLGGGNTLIFAVTKENKLADGEVTFADMINLEGESLYDYELQIASSKFESSDIDREELTGKIPDYDSENNADFSEYLGGTKWFIERVEISKSSAARGFTGAGYASYDAAVEMDRHDRRLAETVRNATDPANGLWVRIHHGRSGAENQYRWDRTGATIGFDRDLSSTNRLGAWFSYTEGDTEFLDVRGDGDMKRYEAAVFDTITLDNHYIDLVARFGRVSSDFSVGNTKFSTSGDYDQDYAAVSAEYGYTLRDPNGVFIEPQVQVQAAYLKSFDYTSNRDMMVEADSATSVIGRAGFRAGRALETSDSAGELYFRADVLHQFTDGQDAEFIGQNERLDETWGDTGTWANFGVGAVWQWKDTLGFQFDLERTAGGKTDDTWLVSGRFNYFF